MDASRNPQVRRGAVAVIQRSSRLLVIRRSKFVSAAGKYCFPGGKIEAGESEESAVQRELHEELSCHGNPIRLLWRSVSPWGVQLAWWLVDLPVDAAVIPFPDEVESVHWLTVDEMLQLDELLESNRQFLERLLRREISLD